MTEADSGALTPEEVAALDKDPTASAQDELRSAFEDFAGPPRNLDTGKVSYTAVKELSLKRQLDIVTYGVAAGLVIETKDDGSLTVDPSYQLPFLERSTREEDAQLFERQIGEIVGEPHTVLSVVGGIEVRGYDISRITEGQRDIIKEAAGLGGWDVRSSSKKLFVIGRKTSEPQVAINPTQKT